GQVPAVAAERHPPDPHLPVVGAKRADRVAGPRVPDLHGSVRSPRHQVAEVGAERHGVVLLPPARELEGLLSGLCVPDLDRKQLTVQAGGGYPLAVGVPGHAEDDTRMAAELEAHLFGLRVPDLDAATIVGRSNLLAVGADRHGPNFLAVLLGQGFLALVPPERGRVPQTD